MKKRLKTIDLFEPVTRTDLILELKEGKERPENKPESGFQGESPGLKIS